MFRTLTGHWPLRRQLIVALGSTVLLVGFMSGELVRRLETDYLLQTFHQTSEKTFSMLSAASIDAVVSEDRPLLETIVAQSVGFDPDIRALTIENELGEPLVTWEQESERPTPADSLFRFSDNVVFEGESFGTINIDWNVENLRREIEAHVDKMRLYAMGVVLALAILFIAAIHRLVVSPVNRIHRRLTALERGDIDPDSKFHLSAAEELVRLSHSVNALQETLYLKQRREAELEQAQHSLSEACERAVEASRTKSEFLANMSHELRTPMNGVLGMLGLLQDTNLNGDQNRCVKVAMGSGKTLLTLINDILDFSKIEAGRLELESIDFDLRNMIEDSVELLAEQAHAKKLELVCLIDPQIQPVVRGDPTRLRQVITNLLANAVKFTESGQVVVRTEVLNVDDGSVKLRFDVEDTGVGISGDALERVFDSFTQADGSTTRKYGGSGLGLAISRQLVERMNGEIHVESELGHGTTFWFTVTLECPEESLPEFSPLPNLNGVRALVVDDNATTREALVACLRAWGMAYESADTTAGALEALREAAAQSEPFEVALLDLTMPELDGLQLSEAIRQDPATADVKIILLTPFSPHAGDTAKVRAVGIDRQLTKPLRQLTLHDGLAVALGLMEPDSEVELRNEEVSEVVMEARRQRRILLVEDNEVNQEVALGMLQKLGYEADVAPNGMDALEALESSEYDLVLMDCQMPVLDGYETTARIRNGENGEGRLPVIALTANAMKGDAEKCLKAGMDGYLAKPIELEALAEKLLEWLPDTSAREPGGGDGIEALDSESDGPDDAATSDAPIDSDCKRARASAGAGH